MHFFSPKKPNNSYVVDIWFHLSSSNIFKDTNISYYRSGTLPRPISHWARSLCIKYNDSISWPIAIHFKIWVFVKDSSFITEDPYWQFGPRLQSLSPEGLHQGHLTCCIKSKFEKLRFCTKLMKMLWQQHQHNIQTCLLLPIHTAVNHRPLIQVLAEVETWVCISMQGMLLPNWYVPTECDGSNSENANQQKWWCNVQDISKPEGNITLQAAPPIQGTPHV